MRYILLFLLLMGCKKNPIFSKCKFTHYDKCGNISYTYGDCGGLDSLIGRRVK